MIDRQNNLDLIRVAAALQVVFLHLNGHLQITTSNEYWSIFLSLIRPFPGVPIFFAISGFLIFASYERNPNLKSYLINRFLRIYPLLYVAAIVTTFLVVAFSWNYLGIKDLFIWLFGQVTIFQFYTPDSLRTFGVGTPNGSLWTIPVEVEFYLIVPLLYKLSRRFGNVALVVLAAISLVITHFFLSANIPVVLKKIYETSVLCYLPHFIIGILIYLYFHRLKRYFVEKGYLWLALYLLFYFIFDRVLGLYHDLYIPNLIGVGAVLLLSGAIFSLAYTKKSVSYSILGKNDFSYGIYVIHMVVANVMVELSYLYDLIYLFCGVAVTVFLAALSWYFIEKPSLKLKRTPSLFNKEKLPA